MRYEGKKAVVIGGTHGMGLATAKMLVDGGATVLVTGRNADNIEAARKTLGDRAYVLRSDASSMGDIAELGTLIGERLGSIDFLHVNVGVAETPAFRSSDRGLL